MHLLSQSDHRRYCQQRHHYQHPAAERSDIEPEARRVAIPEAQRGQAPDLAQHEGQRQQQDRREVHRQIGDMALFWTGIFPESLEANPRQQAESNQFSDYCWQGKRAYLIASRLQGSDTQNAPSAVLERLADQFEMCALGLKTIRQQWKETTGKANGASGILFT